MTLNERTELLRLHCLLLLFSLTTFGCVVDLLILRNGLLTVAYYCLLLPTVAYWCLLLPTGAYCLLFGCVAMVIMNPNQRDM
jgi:hypothetical protein